MPLQASTCVLCGAGFGPAAAWQADTHDLCEPSASEAQAWHAAARRQRERRRQGRLAQLAKAAATLPAAQGDRLAARLLKPRGRWLLYRHDGVAQGQSDLVGVWLLAAALAIGAACVAGLPALIVGLGIMCLPALALDSRGEQHRRELWFDASRGVLEVSAQWADPQRHYRREVPAADLVLQLQHQVFNEAEGGRSECWQLVLSLPHDPVDPGPSHLPLALFGMQEQASARALQARLVKTLGAQGRGAGSLSDSA